MSVGTQRLVVVGGGGHARSVIDAIEALGTWGVEGIVDPNPHASYKEYSVLCSDDGLSELYEKGLRAAALGIGFLGGVNGPREKILKLLHGIGFNLPAVVDPTAVLAADAEVREAAFVGKLAIVNSSACVGAASIINSGAVVEHDCFVGELAHVSVNATLCGGVSIGRGAFVGAGATVIQGVSVGEGAIVGAGTVVLRNVPAREVVVGVYDGKR